MLIVIFLTELLAPTTGFAFTISFPISDIQDNLSKAALEHLNRTHNSKSKAGITWGYALSKLPEELLERHGFTRANLSNNLMADYGMEVESGCYLIPPKHVRLMQISSYMTAHLDKYLELWDPDIVQQNWSELQKKIAEFAVIWAPRFVDLNLHDLDEFIKAIPHRKRMKNTAEYDIIKTWINR